MSQPNPEKPKLEAALSSTPVAAKKSRFRPSFRSPRIPRETKLGLGIIFSLVCVFGYVLYSRLTRPTEINPETYVAEQGTSNLAPSVTSMQPVSHPAAPLGTNPTILSGTAPNQTLPLTNPALQPSRFAAPPSTAATGAWAPNSSTAASNDPFLSRPATSTNAPSNSAPASSFSANGFAPNRTTEEPAMISTKNSIPAKVASYGLADSSEAASEPRQSFLPPADRATTVSAGDSSFTAKSEAGLPMNSPFDAPRQSTPSNAGTTMRIVAEEQAPADAMAPTNLANQLRKEGQDLLNNGESTQNNLSKVADNAGQLLNQTQQQFQKYSNSATTAGSSLQDQLGQTANQYKNDVQTQVQNQATQLTNQLRTTVQDQSQAAQDQFRSTATGMMNDTTSRLQNGLNSTMTKAGDNTQSMLNSASSAISQQAPGLAPLVPTGVGSFNSTNLTNNNLAPAANSYGNNGAAPRTLDQTQMASQPLPNNTVMAANPEQPVRIPAENTNYAAPATAAGGLNFGGSAAATNANMSATPSYNSTPNYGANPSYGAAPNYGNSPAGTAPAVSTPLQFSTPQVPATQPATSPYGGAATRTSFEQPVATRGTQNYTVQGNDSYYSVAEKIYGNGSYNKALFEYNRRHNPNADRLQVGGTMLIPDLASLQNEFPDLVPTQAPINTQGTPLQFSR